MQKGRPLQDIKYTTNSKDGASVSRLKKDTSYHNLNTTDTGSRINIKQILKFPNIYIWSGFFCLFVLIDLTILPHHDWQSYYSWEFAELFSEHQ
jgi:hypothetical protein